MVLEYFIFGTVIALLIRGGECEIAEVLAEEGSQAVLPCKCVSLLPTSPAVVWRKVNKGTVWRKNKSGIQHVSASWSPKGTQRVQCPHYQFDRGDYSLQINNVKEEEAGLFSCTVENSDKVVEKLVMLRIIKMSISPPVPVLENNILISCDVTPWPFRARVTWMLNNSSFAQHTEILSNGYPTKSVVRGTATANLAGNWTCIMDYKGKVGRASATMSVRGIVEPSKDNTKVYAAVGSEVTLPCVFSPGSFPSGSAWEKLNPGSAFLKYAPSHLPASFSSSLPSSQPTLDRSATLKEVQFEDGGMYRCSGTIEGQRLTRKTQLVVAKIDRSISSDKRGSTTLTCQLTDTNDVTDYEWVREAYDNEGTRSFEKTVKGKLLKIDKKLEEKQGEWTCRFYGKQGILGNVTDRIPLTRRLTVPKSSGLSNNTGAVVGLSFLLIVLLLVLVKVYKNYQRRKRIFQYPALETIVHTISNEREERERDREKKERHIEAGGSGERSQRPK